MEDGDEAAWDEYHTWADGVRSRRDKPLIKPEGLKLNRSVSLSTPDIQAIAAAYWCTNGE